MPHKLLLPLLFCCLFLAQARADSPAAPTNHAPLFSRRGGDGGERQVDSLFSRFKSATGFDRTYPREKVYLHLDNASYIEGDSIWYKAYVVRASSLQPTTLSRVLYVDLLNADGTLVEQQTLRLDSLGQADGCIKLALPVRAGYFEVRAYTRAMTNWDANAYFSRIIPVFASSNPQKTGERTLETSIVNLSIPEPEPRKGYSIGQPRQYIMTTNKDRRLSFYPEGGLRARGVAQRIAYRLTDGRGRTAEDTLQVFRADGTLLFESIPDYEGMGRFTLPADFGEGYALLKGEGLGRKGKEEQFFLPHPTADYGLSATMADDGLEVTVSASDSVVQKHALLGLAVICREKTCYFDTLTVSAAQTELFVPRAGLRGGVNRVELFDASGHSHSTRLVWVRPSEGENRAIRVDLKQNELDYAPCSPAVVRLHLTRPDGRPVQTRVSVAVRDHDSDLTETEDGGIGADLLLSSELRGYIHRPDLYFKSNSPARRYALDLLLMVQGWTANTFEVMCAADTFALRQPIEDKLILRGTVYEDNGRHLPMSDINIAFKGYSLKGGSIEGDTRTGSDGRFAFVSNVNFVGNYIGQFTLRDPKNKKKWTRLAFDRWFAARPRPLNANLLELRPAPAFAPDTTALERLRAERTFSWVDTIPNIVARTIQGAEVVGRKRYHGFTGNRYSWGGGEQNVMRKATTYYNIELVVEQMKDLGMPPCSLTQLLQLLSSNFDVESMIGNEMFGNVLPTDGLPNEQTMTSDINGNMLLDNITYRGKPTSVYIDNVSIKEAVVRNPELFDFGGYSSLEDIKSVAIVDDSYRTDAVTGERKRTSKTQYALYVTEQPESWRMRSKKGVERRRIYGFTERTAYFAPDYRNTDLPTDTDLRRTLLWAPSVDTDEQGDATLIFYTNSRPDAHLDISVRGITRHGETVDF